MLSPERFCLLEEAGINWAPVTTASERKWQLCLSQLLAHRRVHGAMQVGDMACDYAEQPVSGLQCLTGLLNAGWAHRRERPASQGLAGSATAPLAPDPASSWPHGSAQSCGHYTGCHVSKLTIVLKAVGITLDVMSAKRQLYCNYLMHSFDIVPPFECMLEQLLRPEVLRSSKECPDRLLALAEPRQSRLLPSSQQHAGCPPAAQQTWLECLPASHHLHSSSSGSCRWCWSCA